MADNNSWQKIFNDYKILQHNFDESPFILKAEMIKRSCQNFEKTSEKEVRILCKQDRRENRPQVFVDNGLFILPKRNKEYYILKGEGYVDIPPIESEIISYKSALDFKLVSSTVGDSEMQHLDFAYASSLVRTFMNDQSLLLTIRGRKYTSPFSFMVGNVEIETNSVQTEVDGGYEGKDQIVLFEAKNSNVSNTVIRQLYYPYRQWKQATNKKVSTLFFEHSPDDVFKIWQFGFSDEYDYNSIYLIKSARYCIIGPNTE